MQSVLDGVRLIMTEEMINKINEILLKGRRVKVCEVAKKVNILKERIFKTLAGRPSHRSILQTASIF